ncbi:transcriptional regulator with XRE-family HTH domain [Kitasatospora gansuensis]|uniref:Transcriptional regulator with XRE-family HTH domain n=1 Tax=Kitasatospora gansuensis TaxID=258050 RepID=A0A7W7SIQ8_9ACTN|nr:helix-turn-helix domain-containing protein [Kitasatospora gansuensis]MBB4951220.1 transcriptional regulator with XRE-family HTH domain [Kitasatospora gansuensis]
MAPHGGDRALEKLTGSSPRAGQGFATVSGHLFKEIRERTGTSQERLAQALGVDKSTLQGWESGRRSLNSSRAGSLRALKRNLLRLGGDPTLLVLLDQALDADSIINFAVDDPTIERAADHPLASWVLTRDTTHMLAWALTGIAPASLPAVEKPARRGPTPASPQLPPDVLRTFFGQMRRAAELAQWSGDDGALLRRQALYLCSYDTSSDTAAWLAEIRRRPARAQPKGWSPDWADDRSVATSLTRHGDHDALAAFMATGMGDEVGEAANLNYWAYWLGIDSLPKADDQFMVAAPAESWDALALLRGLADRLKPGIAAIDLNIHSVWALLALRKGLLAPAPDLGRTLQARVAVLLDADGISTQAREELISLHYGLKLTT